MPRRFRPGCRGRSPRQSKLKISPFPGGEGGRGDRVQENQLKAVATGNKESTPPTERVVRPLPPVPPEFKPRGCKGRSPLHKITINLPLPRRGRALCERGRGDRGQENQLKAVATSAAEQADTATNLRKTKKRRSRAFNQNFQPSNLSSHHHKIHLQPKRRKRRGEKETQTNEEPLHRRGARGSSPRSISIG